MKILAISDIHGKFPSKLKKCAKDVDIIFCPGDLSGRAERSLIFKYFDQIESGVPLADLIPKKKLDGFYKKNIKGLEKVVKELDKLGKPVYIIPGNGDFTKIRMKKRFIREFGITGKYRTLDDMVKKSKNLKLLFKSHLKFKEFDLIAFSRYSYAKDREKTVRQLFSKIKRKGKRTIFMTHFPPYGTRLDLVDNPGTPMHGKHIGDKLYPKLVKKLKPNIYLCGHIHEAQGKTKIGKTLAINTGYGMLGQFAIVELNKQIKVKFFK